MKYYDRIYKENPNFCGARPSKLLIMARRKLRPGGNFLDLGCGQGRDSLYLARNKFSVTAVDDSKVGIDQLKNLAGERKIANLEAICRDIADFKIDPKKYSIISSINSLQFIDKRTVLRIIKDIQRAILPDGLIVIESFTEKNTPSLRRKSHFENGELKRLFSTPRFEIIHYFEGELPDSGHIGAPYPHKHGIVEIIAKKKSLHPKTRR